MADDRIIEVITAQQSLTEWLRDIKHKDAEALRVEDNEKRERLKVLNKVINLPFDKPVQFEATDLQAGNTAFMAYLESNGDELCALRLIPKTDSLPKLRMRGKSVRDAYAWFQEQDVNAPEYRADFIPHEASQWATIFIVNKHGIQGEIITGGHHQLTQGFHDEGQTPTTFSYDFKNWSLQPFNSAALEHLQSLTPYLLVEDESLRAELEQQLGATFADDYLEGYFETTYASHGTWFIDYAPKLGKLYADLTVSTDSATADALVSGQTGAGGTAQGVVQIVDPEHIDAVNFPDGAILVCSVTTPKYVELMEKAAAIVTDQGGILSHAAIVARELKKPCIVATSNATTVLQNGQRVTVNADQGVVLG
jgi:phosphohistidine swiveling domain-containing protein